MKLSFRRSLLPICIISTEEFKMAFQLADTEIYDTYTDVVAKLKSIK